MDWHLALLAWHLALAFGIGIVAIPDYHPGILIHLHMTYINTTYMHLPHELQACTGSSYLFVVWLQDMPEQQADRRVLWWGVGFVINFGCCLESIYLFIDFSWNHARMHGFETHSKHPRHTHWLHPFWHRSASWPTEQQWVKQVTN